jgi:hypothetical protein
MGGFRATRNLVSNTLGVTRVTRGPPGVAAAMMARIRR